MRTCTLALVWVPCHAKPAVAVNWTQTVAVLKVKVPGLDALNEFRANAPALVDVPDVRVGADRSQAWVGGRFFK